VCDLRDV